MRSLTLIRGTAVAGLATAMLVAGGCRYDDRPAGARELAVSPYDDVNLRVEASRRTALVGETVTFKARTENLLGRDAEVQWMSPGGELNVQEEGRIARVSFDEPGVYSVTARLLVEGFEVRRSSETVTVRPVR